MKTILKTLFLPIMATALLTGTAANAQMLTPKPMISSDHEVDNAVDGRNGAPLILVDDDDNDDDNNKRRNKKYRSSGDDDEDNEDDDNETKKMMMTAGTVITPTGGR